MNIERFSTCKRYTAILLTVLTALLIASPAAAATKASAAQIKKSVKLGPWYMSLEVKCTLAKAEFAERNVDLKAKTAGGKALWKSIPHLKDGARRALKIGGGGCRYFYRTMR